MVTRVVSEHADKMKLAKTAQKKLVVAELVRKSKIISQGAAKRGKMDEAHFYEHLIQEVSEFSK